MIDPTGRDDHGMAEYREAQADAFRTFTNPPQPLKFISEWFAYAIIIAFLLVVLVGFLYLAVKGLGMIFRMVT